MTITNSDSQLLIRNIYFNQILNGPCLRQEICADDVGSNIYTIRDIASTKMIKNSYLKNYYLQRIRRLDRQGLQGLP